MRERVVSLHGVVGWEAGSKSPLNPPFRKGGKPSPSPTKGGKPSPPFFKGGPGGIFPSFPFPKGELGGIFLFLIVLLLPLFAAQAGADPPRDLVASGNEFYKAGKVAEALESYEKALKLMPDSPEILFDKGNAHFRNGEFEVAREEYGRAALLSGNEALKAKAHFNLGCAAGSEAVRDSEKADKKALQLLDVAIAHYKEARKLDPQYRLEAGRAIEIARRTIAMIRNKVWVEKAPGEGIKRATDSLDGKKEEEPAKNASGQPESETTGSREVKETPQEARSREQEIHGNDAPRGNRETPADIVQEEWQNSGKFRRFRKTDHAGVKDW